MKEKLKVLFYLKKNQTKANGLCPVMVRISIVTLSQMMGHRNIKTTQIYAEITGAKIEKDMQALSRKIEDKYQLAGD